MKIKQVRKLFVEYYKNMGYQHLPKASMLDPSIPMSFVMSAGLIQVEKSLLELGQHEGRHHVLVQDCFRHFDIDKVGTDNFHLSFFEMPGAFVFGLNGKTKTVKKMWRLATAILGIDKKRIWATYFAGGMISENLIEEDSETRNAWLSTEIDPNQLVGLGTESNYWIQGKGIDGLETRKCGPNTELFFDLGYEKGCSPNCKPGCPCGRFLEFSNSLFVGFEYEPKTTSLKTLSSSFTETVIGIERVAMITQGTQSVFELDEFKSIYDFLDTHTPVNFEEQTLLRSSKNIIFDHLRSIYYLVANGAPPPGKDGRSRIIKMLIRRVITRFLILGIHPLKNVSSIVKYIRDIVPDELHHDWIEERIELYFNTETNRFSRTIERAERQLNRYLNENNDNNLSNTQIDYLEKRMGMPVLLTTMLMKNRQKPYKATYLEKFISIDKNKVAPINISEEDIS